MALPPGAAGAMAEALGKARRPSVIWLPFQECTGCTESITRSHSPSVEGMIFDMISLDYQETLMAAAGFQAEEALQTAMKENYGKYLLIIDGSVATGLDGAYSCIGGRSNLDSLKEAAKGAAAIIALGSCGLTSENHTWSPLINNSTPKMPSPPRLSVTFFAITRAALKAAVDIGCGCHDST